jgi:hypothetical protein
MSLPAGLKQTIPEVNTSWGGEGCRVIGCDADLSDQKIINRKYRLCQVHKPAEALLVDGTLCRFCSQCSSLRPVVNFEETKRACKECCIIRRNTPRIRRRKKPGLGGLVGLVGASSTEVHGLFDQVLSSLKNNKQDRYDHIPVKALMARERRLRAEQFLVHLILDLAEIQHDICKIDGGT